MLYALVLAVFMQGHPPTVQVSYYNTEAQCKQAGVAVISSYARQAPGARFLAGCVLTGEA